MASNKSSGLKKAITLISSAYLLVNALASVYLYGTKAIGANLIFVLPGVISLLYLKDRSKNWRMGVVASSVLAIIISLTLSGGRLNVLSFIAYLMLTIAAF